MQNVLVSIVVPVYNASNYVESTVKSLLNQTYSKIEIILVNDGSKDDSLNVCHRLRELDSRVKVFSQENQGVTKARAIGVEKSLGEWITFVDADDVLPMLAIETLVKNCCTCDIVVGQVLYSVPENWPYPCFSEKCSSLKAVKYLFKKKLHSGPVAKLFRKKLFNVQIFDIPRSITHGEDFIMNIRLFQQASVVNVISDIVYHYIEYSSSVAHNTNPYEKLNYCRLQERYIQNSLLKKNKTTLVPLWAKLVCYHRIMWLKLFLKKSLRDLK